MSWPRWSAARAGVRRARTGQPHVTIALLLVAGAVGAVARFLLEATVQQRGDGSYPWGTFWVNVTGCLALGMITGFADHHGATTFHTVAGTGFCGAYTTFSTFSVESVRLVERQRYAAAARYVGTSLVAAGSPPPSGWPWRGVPRQPAGRAHWDMTSVRRDSAVAGGWPGSSARPSDVASRPGTRWPWPATEPAPPGAGVVTTGSRSAPRAAWSASSSRTAWPSPAGSPRPPPAPSRPGSGRASCSAEADRDRRRHRPFRSRPRSTPARLGCMARPAPARDRRHGDPPAGPALPADLVEAAAPSVEAARAAYDMSRPRPRRSRRPSQPCWWCPPATGRRSRRYGPAARRARPGGGSGRAPAGQLHPADRRPVGV